MRLICTICHHQETICNHVFIKGAQKWIDKIILIGLLLFFFLLFPPPSLFSQTMLCQRPSYRAQKHLFLSALTSPSSVHWAVLHWLRLQKHIQAPKMWKRINGAFFSNFLSKPLITQHISLLSFPIISRLIMELFTGVQNMKLVWKCFFEFCHWTFQIFWTKSEEMTFNYAVCFRKDSL